MMKFFNTGERPAKWLRTQRKAAVFLVGVVLVGVVMASLVAAGPANPQSADTEAGLAVERVVDVMRDELGNTDGEGYEDALLNAGGELCGGKRGLWCTTFLWWAYDEADAGGAFCGGEPISEPRLQAQWYKDHGQFFETMDDENPPQRGDLFFELLAPEYRFEGCGDISHGEFVLGYDARSRTVTCISANPVVEIHQHSVDEPEFRGYARPDYTLAD